MRFYILSLLSLGVLSLSALDFCGGGWRLSLTADGSWNSLQYQGVELIQPGTGLPALKMQLGNRKWTVPRFTGATVDAAANTVQLKYSEAGFEILEKISLNAHGMPGLLGRRIELVCPAKPTVFYNIGFLTPLPLEGFCYAPVSFLGDRRNIREIDDASSHRIEIIDITPSAILVTLPVKTENTLADPIRDVSNIPLGLAASVTA